MTSPLCIGFAEEFVTRAAASRVNAFFAVRPSPSAGLICIYIYIKNHVLFWHPKISFSLAPSLDEYYAVILRAASPSLASLSAGAADAQHKSSADINSRTIRLRVKKGRKRKGRTGSRTDGARSKGRPGQGRRPRFDSTPKCPPGFTIYRVFPRPAVLRTRIS